MTVREQGIQERIVILVCLTANLLLGNKGTHSECREGKQLPRHFGEQETKITIHFRETIKGTGISRKKDRRSQPSLILN